MARRDAGQVSGVRRGQGDGPVPVMQVLRDDVGPVTG